MSEVWTRWQGQVINSTFPLGRCLGSSDHSGVFHTRSATHDSQVVAVKLVPTNRALAELLLPRWKRAGGVTHPHLLPLLQWGGCQLEGLPYLYALMEYADQTLAQLLLQRALTDEEAREMLPPILETLAFLHAQDLVQGQFKPTNVLVVGDQLKLASDTIRRLSEGAISAHAPTAYDPPEARQGSSSPAGDIWALGMTLCEALTQRLPSGSGESREPVLPADFSPAFRAIVARCLSVNPQARPSMAELVAFAGGPSAATMADATAQPAVPEQETFEFAALEPAMLEAVISAQATPAPAAPEAPAPEPPAVEPTNPEPATLAPAMRDVAPAAGLPQGAADEAQLAPSMEQSPKPRALLAALGALLVIALVWAGVRIFSGHRAPVPPPAPVQAPMAPASSAGGATASAVVAIKPARSEATTPPSALHEVIPDVPLAARRTIRGHIKVWVRVIVGQDGSVFAAVPDRAGPSRYFQRLSLEAAKKWTFSPADSPAQRIMQIHFDFSRDGTTGHAVTLH